MNETKPPRRKASPTEPGYPTAIGDARDNSRAPACQGAFDGVRASARVTYRGQGELSVRMDRLLLEGMTFFGRHGALPAERELGARFSVDVELTADLRRAGHTDRLEDTVDYSKAYEVVRQVVEGEPCQLLEAVAERIAGRLVAM